MTKGVVFSTIALCLSLATPSAFSQQQPQQNQKPVPQQVAQAKAPVSQDILAKMESAKQKLTSAREDLINSGGEWGGFRESAIKEVDQALSNVNKAMEYRQSNLKK